MEQQNKNKNIDEKEIGRLRRIVLSWLEKPRRDEVVEEKKLAPRPVIKKEEKEINSPVSKVLAFKPTKIENVEKKDEAMAKIENKPLEITPAPVHQKTTPGLSAEEISQARAQLEKFSQSKKPIEKTETAPVAVKKSLKPIAPKKTTPKKKINILNLIIKLLIALIIILVIFSGCLYYFKWHNKTVNVITRIIPLPAAFVNFKPIFYYSWDSQVQTLNNYYIKEKNINHDLQVPPINQTGNHILERMIEGEILNQTARQYDITVSNEEVNSYLDKLSIEIGGQVELEKQLNELYDWSTKDFVNQIVRPIILKNKLAAAITVDDRINQQTRQRAEKILEEVKNSNQPFEELAQKYSEDITAVQGGDLGYFSQGQMVESFEKAAFALKPGEISDLVQTQFGYHIIKLEEVLKDDQDAIVQVRAKHILIRGVNLDEFLEKTKQDSKIWQLVTS